MKKLLFILLFTISLFHTSLFSQWFKQPIPVNKPMVGIEFTDTSNGWACTNHGTAMDRSYVIRTTNGGTNWAVNYDSAGYNFYAMDVVNDSTVYIAGSSTVNVNGLLIKTTNRGVTWINMNIPVGLIIEDVFAPSKDTVYICSSNSFAPGLWFTSNGGVSWQTRTAGLIGNAVNSLYFLNINTGWCSVNTRVFQTTNAGENWHSLSILSEFVACTYFLNSNTGWVGSSNRKIFHTTNSGANWIEQSNPGFSGTISDFYFSSLAIGWAGNYSVYLYKTTNNGSFWGYQLDSAGSRTVSFLDSSKGWTALNPIGKTLNGGGPITYVGIVSSYVSIPKQYSLLQNYPNPFNSETKIRFKISKTGYVKLEVFDILGREKILWQSGKQLGAGSHELSFKARDLASGVYFYRLIVSDESGNTMFKETRKMILVK